MPSATVHSRFAATAARLIDKHGRLMVLVRQTQTGTEWNPTIEERLAAVVGVQTQYTAAEINGDLVRSDDKRYLIDSAIPIRNDMRIRDVGPDFVLGNTPLGQWVAGADAFGVADYPTEGVADFSIVNVEALRPGNTTILYRVQARI